MSSKARGAVVLFRAVVFLNCGQAGLIVVFC